MKSFKQVSALVFSLMILVGFIGCTKTEKVFVPVEYRQVTVSVAFDSPLESEVIGINSMQLLVRNDSLGINDSFLIDQATPVITPAGVYYQIRGVVTLTVSEGDTPFLVKAIYHGFPAEVSSAWPSQNVTHWITLNDSKLSYGDGEWMHVTISCAGDIDFGISSVGTGTQAFATRTWLGISPNNAGQFPDGAVVSISMIRVVLGSNNEPIFQPVLMGSDQYFGTNVPTYHYKHRAIFPNYWSAYAEITLPPIGGIVGFKATMNHSNYYSDMTQAMGMSTYYSSRLPDDPANGGYAMFWISPSNYGDNPGGKG